MNTKIPCDRGRCPATLTIINGAVVDVDCREYTLETHVCRAKWPPDHQPESIFGGVLAVFGPYMAPTYHLVHHSRECQFKLDEVVRHHIMARVEALKNPE